jgi:hypothetical protein
MNLKKINDMKKWKCYRKTDQHKIKSVFDEKGLKVCDINYYLNEESEANAKLISFAPEMLEELKNIVQCWDNDVFQELDIECIRELIEKATTI